MSENEQLKNVIQQWGWRIMKRLELPLIKIEFDLKYDDCSYTHDSLLFGLDFLKEFKNNNMYKEIVPPMEFFDRLYFIVAHEIAHYLQEYRHLKWYKKYKSSGWRVVDTMGISSHARRKLERNASKIAGILLKEYKIKLDKSVLMWYTYSETWKGDL